MLCHVIPLIKDLPNLDAFDAKYTFFYLYLYLLHGYEPNVVYLKW